MPRHPCMTAFFFALKINKRGKKMAHRIDYNEEMVGNAHPTKADTLNRLINVFMTIGDTIYATAAATAARLAKGTAFQVLRMNAGATAPEWGSGSVIQVVNTQTGALATGATILPVDNTIPQITEGNEYMTLAITPMSATNKLKIDITFVGSSDAASDLFGVALFKDAVANALAGAIYYPQTFNRPATITFSHTMVAGTVAAITFRVRAGSNAAGTTTFNGSTGAGLFFGVMASSITIAEIVV